MTGGGKEDISWGLRTGKASQRRSLQEFSFRIQQRVRLKLGCQLLASSNSPYPRSSFKSEETGAPANELAGPPVSREPPEAGQAQQGGESTSAGCGPPAIRNYIDHTDALCWQSHLMSYVTGRACGHCMACSAFPPLFLPHCTWGIQFPSLTADAPSPPPRRAQQTRREVTPVASGTSSPLKISGLKAHVTTAIHGGETSPIYRVSFIVTTTLQEFTDEETHSNIFAK